MKKNGENELKQILEMSEQRMDKLLEFYKNNEKLNQNDEYYNQNIIFILITLIEIELMKSKLQKKEMNKIKIPAFNLKLKKIFQFNFEDIDLNDNFFIEFNNKINIIEEELKDLVDIEKVSIDYNISVIDDLIISDKYNDYLINIIDKAYKSNFHKSYINYIKEFMAFVIKGNYTNDILDKLIFVKYITQIMIFIKIYIKHRLVKKEKPSILEIMENDNYIFDENINMIYFTLDEVGGKRKRDSSYLLKDNEEIIKELIEFNELLLKIIKYNENKLNNINNDM